MSNLATVFHTAPKWTNVEAIDATDVINSAYKNAELQNKAFNNLADAGADVFKYAQQHRLNEVEKEINAMNLDQFQAADKAALVDGLVAKYGTDIGGFDAANMNRINKYVDDRDTTLINDEVNKFTYNAGLRKDTTEGMQFDADNTASAISTLTNTASLLPEGHPDKEPLLKQAETFAADFITKHASGGNVLNQSLQKIKDGDIEAKTRTTQLEAAYADGVTKLYGPSYITYLNQHSDLKKREAEANSLEDPEAKKAALDQIALDRAALTAHYGSDMIESLKNPHILSRLEQRAYEDFHAKRMSEAEYQATISAIENAKEELGIKREQIAAQVYLGEQGNAVKLHEIEAKGSGSGRSSSEIKAATENNVNRLTSVGLTKEQALGFIDDNGEFNPDKILASTLAYVNNLQTQNNNAHIQGSKVSASEWFTKEAPTLAKNAGVSDTRLRDYYTLANKHGKTDAEKIRIVEAGIAGRLDIAYQGNGQGIIDMFGVARNNSVDNMEHTLLNKNVLHNIRAEIANEAFYGGAKDFSLYLQAINTAYPTGLEGFVVDNAVALNKNKAFRRYADANTIKLLDEALKKRKSSDNAGKTLGVQEQPNRLPVPSNVSVMTGLPNNPSTQQKPQSSSNGKGKDQNKTTPTSTSTAETPVGWERSKKNAKENLGKAFRYFGIN